MILFLAVVGCFALGIWLDRVWRARSALQAIANHYGGKYQTDLFALRTRLLIPVGANVATMTVGYRAGSNPYYLGHVVLALSGRNGSLRINEWGLVKGLVAAMSWNSRVTGVSREFERVFEIQGDVEMFRDILGAELQINLLRLVRLGSKPTFRIQNEHLDIGWRFEPNGFRLVDSVVDLLRFVHERSRGEPSGVVFEPTQQLAALSTKPQCVVCGDAGDGKLVRCARCGAVHHAECWRYLSQCGVFGCGERKSLAWPS